MDPMLMAAKECQRLARLLGDRQNSDSTLKAREAQSLVTALLDAGNQLECVVRSRPPAESALVPDLPDLPDLPGGPAGTIRRDVFSRYPE